MCGQAAAGRFGGCLFDTHICGRLRRAAIGGRAPRRWRQTKGQSRNRAYSCPNTEGGPIWAGKKRRERRMGRCGLGARASALGLAPTAWRRAAAADAGLGAWGLGRAALPGRGGAGAAQGSARAPLW
jgi:hypothetical protein